MAETKSAWGIDIGQAGLKAIKLRTSEDGQKVFAVAFDYIAHPKILSQPDAIPEELIREAMKTFLERNKVDGDLIAISVPGQSSLAKFIKLPPVESSKVAEIVRYEARQQIPFDLNDVIWDYQPVGGGVEESGFMLEAEVGLFAMKRELVYDAMKPFTQTGREVELVQMAPLALYNFLSYDVLGFRRTAETPEPPAQEDYQIVLDMGSDNSTMLVSNGRSIWIRNVPIGGNHFTRALTREMKLTFAKAEHLKCNATKAPDPKAVFQAMRPVFNDFVSEIQRTIGFFGSVNRSARIRRIIGVGNGFRLAGLQRFLEQNLQQYTVERLETLRGVTGDSVLTDPLFSENIMTFAVPYGLALQALGRTRIRTTLLPPEIAMDRKIRAKKPWAVAGAAGLLLAMGISTIGSASVLQSWSEKKWDDSQKYVKSVQGEIGTQKTAFDGELAAHKTTLDNIAQLVAPLEKRSMWMELFKAVNECLPSEEGNALDETDIMKQKKIRLTSITTRKVTDVAEWHKKFVDAGQTELFAVPDQTAPAAAPGYIVTLRGFHFYNHKDLPFEATDRRFVESAFVSNLRKWTLDAGGVDVPVGQLGISYPIVAYCLKSPMQYDPNQPTSGMMTGGGMMGGGMLGGGMMDGMLGGSGADGGDLASSGGVGMPPGMSGGAGMMSGAGMRSGMGPPGMGGAAMGPPGMAGGAAMGPPGMGSGAGMMGPGKRGAPGAGGEGTGNDPNQLTGAQGPIFQQQEQKQLQVLDRSDFVVQFIWTPTVDRDRKPEDPRMTAAATAGGGDAAAAPADPAAAPAAAQ
ncbi:MAG: hypothetical protein RIT02_4117 [Planctomycetota bacterium]|jgi:type IV pilus assembly protein PilM